MKNVKLNASIVDPTSVNQPIYYPQGTSVASRSRRAFLRASGAASVATVLALNGLTIDLRADGNSSGSTFSPDYVITFSTETTIASLPGSLNLDSAQHYGEEYGASGADSGSENYNPETHKIESTDAVSPSWSTTPTQSGSNYIVPAGTTLTFPGVRKAVPK
jgi:hypothetical protein